MKEVTYLDGIRQYRDILALAERATGQLEEILKSFAPIVSAEWDMRTDLERPEVTLRIWEDTGSMMTRFPARVLKDPDKTHDQLHRLWSDLLQLRSHVLQKRLESMIEQYEGD